MKDIFNSIIEIEQEINDKVKVTRVNYFAVLLWAKNPSLSLPAPMVTPGDVLYNEEYEEFKPVSKKQPFIQPIGEERSSNEITKLIKTLVTELKDIRIQELKKLVSTTLENQSDLFENYYKPAVRPTNQTLAQAIA